MHCNTTKTLVLCACQDGKCTCGKNGERRHAGEPPDSDADALRVSVVC